MSQRFYVEDTCALKSHPLKIGQIDRTHGDVSSHRPDYPDGIERGKGVSKAAHLEFLHSGIPPRCTVLVSWIRLPWQLTNKSALVSESELELVDRCLLAGDIVKRNNQDAVSGTVIRTSTSVSLIQPVRWPPATSRPSGTPNKVFGNYSNDSRDILCGVSTNDLVPAGRYEPDQFVIYRDWVGKVVDTWEDVYLRLSNGSVVVVDDQDELQMPGVPESLMEVLVVGDFVTTKKANLRRGRWIYGAFNADVEPSGYIAEIRTTSLEVDWLCSRPAIEGTSPSQQPPYEVDSDILESGELHIYDRRSLPTSQSKSGFKRIDLDVSVGKPVRFRDIAGAAVKYDGKRTLPDGSQQRRLNRISRTDASGYDINVFMVAGIETTTKVLWQDLTISELPSKSLVPYLDSGGEDEVWPGELIATRDNASAIESIYQPQKVGIVQSVNAVERMAKVKWFPRGVLLFTHDTQELQSLLLPGSFTGTIADEVENVSLYDIWSLPGLSRRLGDYIIVQPPPSCCHLDVPVYDDVIAVTNSASEARDWFGEIIELGLDGRLTVRLGASTNVRDVKVPWDSTFLIYSSDLDDDDVDGDVDLLMEEEMDTDSDEDTSSSVSEMIEVRDGEGVWRQVEAEPDDMEDWTTDDEGDGENEPEAMDTTEDNSSNGVEEESVMQKNNEAKITVDALPASPAQPAFAYGTMFPRERPDSFAILEGSAPEDHHFSGRQPQMNNLQLRRIQREHKILQTSLPDGVYVRTWESALDLLQVLILGPLDTPYEFAPFLIDLYLDANFPAQPPQAFFHSWTGGTGPVNPNLYEDGKICLSLLGTWHGDEKNETWSSQTSTILQLLVSLLGLVLVKEPFYNEAGYESRAGTVEARIPSAIYSERTYFKSRAFITHVLNHPVKSFEKEIQALYLGQGPRLLKRAILEALQVIARSRDGSQITKADDKERRVSVGALVPLRRQVAEMVEVLKREDEVAGREAERVLQDICNERLNSVPECLARAV